MQPVQDLTLDTHDQPHPVPIHPGKRRLDGIVDLDAQTAGGAAASKPELADVVSNQEDNGLAAYVTIDRDSAARLGISVGTVDNALYDAFGQRIVSTIFTQSNQYRVILEADPAIVPVGRLAGIDLRAVGGRRPGAAVGDRQGRCGDPAAAHQSPGAVPGDHRVLQSRARRIARRRRVRDRKRRARPRDAEQHPHDLPRRRARLPQQPDQRAAVAGGRGARHVHRAGRVVRKLHSPDHHSFDAAVGGHRRAARPHAGRRRSDHHRADRHHSADRHREEERHPDDRFRGGRAAR